MEWYLLFKKETEVIIRCSHIFLVCKRGTKRIIIYLASEGVW